MSLKSPPTAADERCKFWVAGDVGLELLHARYRSQRFVAHTHEEYSVGVILDGALGFRHERLDDAAPAGTVKAVNPGDVHTGFAAAERGWRYRNFFIAADVMRRAAIEADGDDRLPDFPCSVLHDPEIARELAACHRLLELSADRLARESATLSALSRLIARCAVGRRRPRAMPDDRGAIVRARDLIEDRFADPLSLDELAQAAGLSPCHFLRLFRRETGLTPHAYLLQVRIDRAKRMLARGVPVVDAALACGFADQSHLTRRFKRVVGVPPGQYRTSCRPSRQATA